MNYLVAVDTFFPDRPTGSARVAWDAARLMRDRGHRTVVFCRKQTNDAEQVSSVDGVEVVRFPWPRTFSLDPLKVSKQIRAGTRVAAKHLGSTKWDIVHVHLPIPGNALHRLFGSTSKFVYTVHSPLLLEQSINWSHQGWQGRIKWFAGRRQLLRLEGNLLHQVDKIQTLSSFTKESLDKLYGIADKITVIPHWCRPDFFRRRSQREAREILNWPADSRMFFSVRRLVPRMGLDDAIRALAPLLKQHPNTFFAIAGSGSLEGELKQLVKTLQIEDNVSFLGRVSDETLRHCFEASDLAIIPTRSLECFGLPILESLAFGVPVISTDAAALPELMQPILPQCVVPAGNVSRLREKLDEYLQNKLDLPTSEKLTAYAKDLYGEQRITTQLVDFLEQ